MSGECRPPDIVFNATKQCCWRGNSNTRGLVAYAGERQCLTCGWGGNGEPDVPCMYYKITQSLAEVPHD